MLLVSGRQDAETTVLFAHGAGLPMDAPFMSAFAEGWAAAGLRVARFEFPYMSRRRSDGQGGPPDRLPVLEATFLAHAAEQRDASACLVLAGKSLGGRVATRVAERAGADAVIALGYPFHPPGRPGQLRTAHLLTLPVPTLILQGTRDRMGSREEVATYALSPSIDVRWIEGGDHSFEPLVRSGRTTQECLREALESSVEWLRARGASREVGG